MAKSVGPSNFKKPAAAGHDAETLKDKNIQPHLTVTKPNGMGRTVGAPRGHRELPKPIIPTPTQGKRKMS
jgi:hypothetical protein